MRRASYVILFGGPWCVGALFLAVLGGCPKSEVTQDAAASASAIPVASQVTLAPLDTGIASAIPAESSETLPSLHPTNMAPAPAITTTNAPTATHATTTTTTTTTGAGASAAQAQARRCCAALHRQSQQPAPQQAQLAQAAMACDALVSAMGENIPQLAQVKGMLQGVPIPPVCQGL